MKLFAATRSKRKFNNPVSFDEERPSRHIMNVNPAHSVRGPKDVVKKGKTPMLAADEARILLDSIDTSTVMGLCDRALIALMAYTFARVSAATAMKVEDYSSRAGAVGWGSMRKVASSTKSRHITISMPI